MGTKIMNSSRCNGEEGLFAAQASVDPAKHAEEV
jgi:hypothetical protein